MKLRATINSKYGEGAGSDRIDRIIQIILVICLVVTPVHSIWQWPLVGHKFQPPEFAFLLLFFVAVPYILRNSQKLWFSPVDAGVLIWLGVNVFSGLNVGLSEPIFFELLGTLYLTVLYFMIRLTIGENFVEKFPYFLSLTATIAALFAIMGWCLMAAGIETMLVDGQTALPLLGNIVARATAFTGGNNLLAHILMVGILVKIADCWHKDEFSPRNLAALGIMLSGFMLTFSKTGIILLIGLILVWYFSTRQRGRLLIGIPVWTTVLLLFLLYNSIALFHPLQKDDPNYKKIVSIYHARAEPIATAGPFDIMLTRYATHIGACLTAFKESFPWGIGPGEFRSFAYRTAKEGLIQFRPVNVPERVMPHTTYFGALAQLGVLGILSILILWSLIGYGCYQVFQIKEYRGLTIGLSVSFIATAINATFIDIMNFRHLWWLIAITAVLWHNARLKKAKYQLGIDD